MDPETDQKNDETTKSGEVQDDSKGGAASEKKTDETKSDEKTPHQSALEAVAARRKELAGTSAAEPKKQGGADEKKDKAETSTQDADDKSDDAQADDEKEEKDGKEPRVFSAEEIAKPGFFDSLDKEGWAAFTKQHPATAAAYKAAKADLTRLGQKLAEKAADIEAKNKAASATAAAATTEAEDEELKALGFTPDDLKKLLGSKAGQTIIKSIAEDTVKSMGVDPERSEAQVQGFELALADYPELKDDEVWNEVQQAIMADPKASKALDEASNPDSIFRVLASKAGRIIANRAKTDKVAEKTDDKKRAKETKNATQPQSRAVGKPRVAPSTSVDEKAPLKDRMRQFVADERIKKGYKELSS